MERSACIIALVVAVGDNSVIGVDGDLAWRISDDLKWFKKVTMGKPIIMGRKTFESIGRPLPGRRNIVVTRSETFTADGIDVFHSIDAAIDSACDGSCENSDREICIIGGGEIYRQSLDRANRIYLSRVDATVDGDTFFPIIESSAWTESVVGNCVKSDRNDYGCEFVILDRKN